MSFYPDKCNTLPVTGGKKTMPHSYGLRGHQLETVNTTKYLEVMIQKDAGKDKHINIMCSKVSRALSSFCFLLVFCFVLFYVCFLLFFDEETSRSA